MIIIKDNFNIKLKYKTYIALGSFDGLHIGHISLIKKAIEKSKISNSKSMIFTFRNHPLTTINIELAPKLIMDIETKTDLFEKLGIDILNYAVFDEDFMKISPENFIIKLINHYNCEGIVVGFNYRFGYKNLGDVELLKQMSKKLNFKLHIVNPIKINNEIVSSSRIRNLISEGYIEKSNKLLTRPFVLKGKVIEGKQRGRKFGFPTINLDYEKKFILPQAGVYYTLVEYNNNFYKGITNIGYNPTFKNKKLSIETHILDFKKNIYSEIVTIYFIQKIRNEKKFNSIEELSIQLEKDKTFAKKQQIDLQFKNSLL